MLVLPRVGRDMVSAETSVSSTPPSRDVTSMWTHLANRSSSELLDESESRRLAFSSSGLSEPRELIVWCGVLLPCIESAGTVAILGAVYDDRTVRTKMSSGRMLLIYTSVCFV